MRAEVHVSGGGVITLDGVPLTQAEAIALATQLVQAVQHSIDCNQRDQAGYYESARVLKRRISPLGQAIAALDRVFA